MNEQSRNAPLEAASAQTHLTDASCAIHPVARPAQKAVMADDPRSNLQQSAAMDRKRALARYAQLRRLRSAKASQSRSEEPWDETTQFSAVEPASSQGDTPEGRVNLPTTGTPIVSDAIATKSGEAGVQVETLAREVARLSEAIEANTNWPAGLSAGQAIKYTGLSPKQFGRLAKAGMIKPFRAPGSTRRLFRRVDLDKLLARLAANNDPARDMDFGED